MNVVAPQEQPALRTVIQQPGLPAYRVPVFADLARRDGIALTVYYGDRASGPPNTADVGFNAVPVHLRETRIAGQPLMWHGPQWRCATRRHCDVLVLSWDIHYASLVPALLRARAQGVRTVLWGHGYSKQEAAWRSWPRERIGRLADALLLYNHTAAQRYLEAGWDSRRIFVALNAIDQSPIQAARQYWLERPEELADFQRAHGLDSGPTLLFVSRLAPENRLDLMVEALAQLAPRHPGVGAVIVGKGEDEQRRLVELASRRGVADRLRLLGAIYEQQQLAPWFLSADVFCYPSNMGLSILHAFGYGLPVVTSDQPSDHGPEIEALRDGQNGLVYRRGDAASLAQALGRLLDEAGLREKLAAEALRTATEQFKLANMVDGFERAIRGVGRREA